MRNFSCDSSKNLLIVLPLFSESILFVVALLCLRVLDFHTPAAAEARLRYK